MTTAPATHWLTKYDGDDGAWPYLVMCSCPVGSDHDALGTPMPSPERQLAIARHHYGTEPTATEADQQAMSPELQDEVLKLVRLAVSDPGAFLSRGRERRDGETIYETIPAWGARAVLAAIERHPIVAIRPDRPTQWAYDQACAALVRHRQRADEAAARLAELAEQPSHQTDAPLADDHSDPPGQSRTGPDQPRPIDMQELHRKVADHIRETVRLSIGERAAAILNAGDVVILSGREADDAATAALQVVNGPLTELETARTPGAFHNADHMARLLGVFTDTAREMADRPDDLARQLLMYAQSAIIGAEKERDRAIALATAVSETAKQQGLELVAERDRAKGIAEGLAKELRDAVAARGQAERKRDEAQASNSRLRGLLECAAGAIRRIRTERDEARVAIDRVREQRDQARLAVRAAAQLADGDDPNEDRPTAVDAARLAEILGEVDQYCPGCWRLHGTWCDPHGGTGYGATGRSST